MNKKYISVCVKMMRFIFCEDEVINTLWDCGWVLYFPEINDILCSSVNVFRENNFPPQKKYKKYQEMNKTLRGKQVIDN